jgi:hypothetical protein
MVANIVPDSKETFSYLYVDDKIVFDDLKASVSGQSKCVAQCLREAVRYYVYSGNVQGFFVSGGLFSGSCILVTK